MKIDKNGERGEERLAEIQEKQLSFVGSFAATPMRRAAIELPEMRKTFACVYRRDIR
jgi:hypothetical protein